MLNQERLSIVGAGIMGHTIALSASWAGLDVKIWAMNEEDIINARAGLKSKLTTLVNYDVFDDNEKKRILNGITFTESLADCVSKATFVIEAVPEDLKIKQEMFQKIETLCSKDTIIGSNTSGLSATDIAKLTSKPSRALVTHFWLPAHLMPLVEVVRGEHTSDETVERSLALLKAMNKKPILVKKDVFGSVGNRIQYAIFREAQHILSEGIASMEDIDIAIEHSLGRRFGVTGPFKTMDMGGLNTNASITSYLFEDLSNKKEIFPQMKELVDKGHYGPKTGKGFYEWTPKFTQKVEKDREEELIEWLKKDLEKLN